MPMAKTDLFALSSFSFLFAFLLLLIVPLISSEKDAATSSNSSNTSGSSGGSSRSSHANKSASPVKFEANNTEMIHEKLCELKKILDKYIRKSSAHESSRLINISQLIVANLGSEWQLGLGEIQRKLTEMLAENELDLNQALCFLNKLFLQAAEERYSSSSNNRTLEDDQQQKRGDRTKQETKLLETNERASHTLGGILELEQDDKLLKAQNEWKQKRIVQPFVELRKSLNTLVIQTRVEVFAKQDGAKFASLDARLETNIQRAEKLSKDFIGKFAAIAGQNFRQIIDKLVRDEQGKKKQQQSKIAATEEAERNLLLVKSFQSSIKKVDGKINLKRTFRQLLGEMPKDFQTFIKSNYSWPDQKALLFGGEEICEKVQTEWKEQSPQITADNLQQQIVVENSQDNPLLMVDTFFEQFKWTRGQFLSPFHDNWEYLLLVEQYEEALIFAKLGKATAEFHRRLMELLSSADQWKCKKDDLIEGSVEKLKVRFTSRQIEMAAFLRRGVISDYMKRLSWEDTIESLLRSDKTAVAKWFKDTARARVRAVPEGNADLRLLGFDLQVNLVTLLLASQQLELNTGFDTLAVYDTMDKTKWNYYLKKVLKVPLVEDIPAQADIPYEMALLALSERPKRNVSSLSVRLHC